MGVEINASAHQWYTGPTLTLTLSLTLTVLTLTILHCISLY